MAARWDLLLVALAGVHAAAVLTLPGAPLIAIGVWWNSNTIAHNFIHRPFFRRRALNLLFSSAQSMLLGIPQRLWRDRHLAHHGGCAWRLEWSAQLAIEATLVTALWSTLAIVDPGFFLFVYLPGYACGLALCAAQGYLEHAGATTSHYGWLYNTLCFNDGYHVEHHAYPGVHWRALPRRVVAGAPASRWPALLRWIDDVTPAHPKRSSRRVLPAASQLLDALERLVLRLPRLQRFVLGVHRTAIGALLRELPPPARVGIVGGGLFPRTAILLRELVPRADLVVIDTDARHLDTAREMIDGRVTFQHAWFSATEPAEEFDLVVIPLAFQGDRASIYERPPARAVLVHDWIWRRRGRGHVVSFALLKRVNLVRA